MLCSAQHDKIEFFSNPRREVAFKHCSMPRPIVVVGSINLDLVADGERIPAPGETLTGKRFETFFGGKGANQAVGVAQLGQPVAMVGRVGDDEFGGRLFRGLRDAGVSTAGVDRTAGSPSGVALITVDAAGRNAIVVVPGANGRLAPDDIKRRLALLSSASLVLTQLEIPLETVSFLADFAFARQIPLMLDPAPARNLPVSLLRKVTWFTPNETEATALCPDESRKLNAKAAGRYADALLAKGPKNVVIKLGSAGAFWASADGARALVPAFRVRALDSTAAGDAFNAALAVALAQGRPPLDALRFASAAAAISVTRRGAQSSMPSADEVGKLLSSPRRTRRAVS